MPLSVLNTPFYAIFSNTTSYTAYVSSICTLYYSLYILSDNLDRTLHICLMDHMCPEMAHIRIVDSY
jgi:hypothetical protein